LRISNPRYADSREFAIPRRATTWSRKCLVLTTEQLPKESLALPAEERACLAEAILASCDPPGDLPFYPAWLAEARRRCAEVDAGGVPLTPWDEVKQSVRQKLERKPRG
jgi:putative addiction module component (TIGR02574 family)